MTAPAQPSVLWNGRPIPSQMPPQVDGEHLFVLELVFRISAAPEEDRFVDHENVLAHLGPHCWWCHATSDDGSICLGFSI